MARTTKTRGLPHAKYGVDLTKVPDTYIEPFTAYRAWNWTEEGITSLNGVLWTPKKPFEAVCRYEGGIMGLPEGAKPGHQVPDPSCSCGMYAGINMQHLIDIGYIDRGIHGEVSLWGRLYRHTLGWRAQFAYPKNFIVPANMIPFDMREAQRRLDQLTEYGVDIYLQTDTEPSVGQEKVPLWIAEYGYSQQGLSWLVNKRAAWYQDNPRTHSLAVGDRVAVFSSGSSGIGIVKHLEGEEVWYTLFNPNVVYRKDVKDIKWNERNWRWETTGTGVISVTNILRGLRGL